MSLLTANKNYLSTLIQAGEDAMTNLYYLEFEGVGFSTPTYGSDNKTVTKWDGADHKFTVRCEQFTPPQMPEHKTNTVHFLTDSEDIPTTGFDFTKQLQFTFRLDANYELYRRLLLAEKEILNANNSSAQAYAAKSLLGSKPKDMGFTIKAYVASSSDPNAEDKDFGSMDSATKEGWHKAYQFDYCWIKTITPPSFSYEGQDAQTIGVTVIFYQMEGPNFSTMSKPGSAS